MPQDFQGVIDFKNSDFRKEFSNFHYLYTEEPHFSRREEILRKYPEIKKLYVKEWTSAIYLAVLFSMNLFLISQAHKMSTLVTLLCAYCLSATFIHQIYILNHDFTHFLAFNSIPINQICSFFCSFSAGLPYGLSFGKYHREHHRY